MPPKNPLETGTQAEAPKLKETSAEAQAALKSLAKTLPEAAGMSDQDVTQAMFYVALAAERSHEPFTKDEVDRMGNKLAGVLSDALTARKEARPTPGVAVTDDFSVVRMAESLSEARKVIDEERSRTEA